MGKLPRTLHRIRVTLDGVHPEVWRRIEVPSHWRLFAMAVAINMALGRDTIFGAVEIGDTIYETDGSNFETVFGSELVVVADVLPVGTSFSLLGGFDDVSLYRAYVETIVPANADDVRARCLDGRSGHPTTGADHLSPDEGFNLVELNERLASLRNVGSRRAEW